MYDNNTTDSSKAQVGGVRIVDVELAIALGGDRESMFLCQVFYWLMRSKHRHDGATWIYNTLDAWQEQFPFVCKRTVQNVIKKLIAAKVLKTGSYNKKRYDHTRWYSIDFAEVFKIAPGTVARWAKQLNDFDEECMANLATSNGHFCHTYTMILLHDITLALDTSSSDDLNSNTSIPFSDENGTQALNKAKEEEARYDVQIKTIEEDEDMAHINSLRQQNGEQERQLDAFDTFLVKMVYHLRGDGRTVEYSEAQAARWHDVVERTGGDLDSLIDYMFSGAATSAILDIDRFLSYLRKCIDDDVAIQWRLPIADAPPPPDAEAVLRERLQGRELRLR